MSGKSEYLFGDTDLAARRLKVLADVFAASSRTFMSEAAASDLQLALDLGCGPGHTTHLLAGALRCERVVGLDNSQQFIRLAARTTTDKVSFRLHDVTAVPFPVGPCDLVHARFLLTHQTVPEKLIANWATQLSAVGWLLLEEVNSIHTEVPVFTRYLGIVEAMLAAGGYDLCIGPRLDAMAPPGGLARCVSRVTCVPVTNDLAATMFSMNIHTWKDNPFVRASYSPGTIREMEEELVGLAAEPTGEAGMEWRLRQIVWRRRKGQGNAQ